MNSLKCPRCAEPVEPDELFCASCGSALAPPSAAPSVLENSYAPLPKLSDAAVLADPSDGELLPPPDDDADRGAAGEAYASVEELELFDALDRALFPGDDEIAFQDYSQAHAVLEALVAHHPEQAQPYAGAALCNSYLGRDERALECVETALRLGYGSDSQPAISYTKCDDDGDEFEVTLSTEVLELLRAGLYVDLGRAADAWAELEWLDEATDEDLQSDVHGVMCLLHFEEGDVAAAKRDMGEALAWDADSEIAHWMRGRIAEAEGDHRRALKAYNRAISIDSSLPEARLDRARCLLAIGDAQSARKDLQMVDAFIENGFEGRAVIEDLEDLKRRAQSA